MFTGIIEEIGILRNISSGSHSGSVTIGAVKVLQDVQIGDSMAVNGVCLTVTSLTHDQFTADVMPVTLKKTNLGQLTPGKQVNLERALQLQSRLGGHLVSGHIDSTGILIQKEQDENAIRFEIELPEKLKNLTIAEGSIAIDGISLTIAELTEKGVLVSIIPHTAEATTLGDRKIGDLVNIEADLIGKYLYHFWQRGREQENAEAMAQPSGITKEFLLASGFL